MVDIAIGHTRASREGNFTIHIIIGMIRDNYVLDISQSALLR